MHISEPIDTSHNLLVNLSCVIYLTLYYNEHFFKRAQSHKRLFYDKKCLMVDINLRKKVRLYKTWRFGTDKKKQYTLESSYV